jgi:cytidylate kinase
MTIPPSIERAKAYLDAHLTHPVGEPHPQFGPPEGPFITISRESGSGGSTLAQMLADHLNAASASTATPAWTVFDQNLVDEVLRTQRLSPQLARFLPENRVSEIESSVRELVGLHPNLWMLVQQTNVLIHELAKHGHAILVGRGANFATKGLRNGLHLRLIGPPGVRADHMARRLKISVGDAATHNRQIDAARRDYVRSVFDANVNDPTSYDLVINVGRTTPAATVEMLLPLVKIRGETAAGQRTGLRPVPNPSAPIEAVRVG